MIILKLAENYHSKLILLMLLKIIIILRFGLNSALLRNVTAMADTKHDNDDTDSPANLFNDTSKHYDEDKLQFYRNMQNFLTLAAQKVNLYIFIIFLFVID